VPRPAAAHETFLAHGVGGPSDLPIPASYAYVAAAFALLVSFGILGLAWRESRFHGDDSGRPMWPWLARIVDSRVTHAVVVVVALTYTAWVVMAAVFGKDILVNPTFGAAFVLLWVGLVPASLLFGPIYRLCNPLRWLHRGISAAAGTDYRRGLQDFPARLGLWPASFFLFAFVWLELIDPSLSSSLSSVRLWFGVVAALLMVGAAVYGDTFFARSDPFEVYSGLVARLSPFGRRTDGLLVVRNPLENLDGLKPRAGLVAVVSVLFGSTAFDSFKESSRWLRFAQSYNTHQTLLNTIALLSFCLIVFVSFSLAAILTGGLGHTDEGDQETPRVRRRDLPNLFAHSIVPIVIGYIVAHYLSFFVSTGIATLQDMGDPLSRGWTLTSFLNDVNKYAIYTHPTGLAVTKVIAVVTGHVLGVVAAHDRAVRLLPRRHALVGQLPMLVLMVAYTLTGLFLLFSS
jgi:hypothetical protein